MLRIDIRRNPVTKVKYVPIAGTEALEDISHFLPDPLRRCIQHRRIHVALKGHSITNPGPGITDIGSPVQTNGIRTGIGNGFQPLTAILGKQDHWHPATIALANQAVNDLPHVAERELFVRPAAQNASPGIENLYSLGTGLDLAVEVVNDRVRQMIQQAVHNLWLAIHELLGLPEILGRAPFNHIGGEGPRASGEADQGNTAIQRTADGGDRVHDVIQVHLSVDLRQSGNIGFGADRVPEFRALAGFEVQAETQSIRNGQDV